MAKIAPDLELFLVIPLGYPSPSSFNFPMSVVSSYNTISSEITKCNSESISPQSSTGSPLNLSAAFNTHYPNNINQLSETYFDEERMFPRHQKLGVDITSEERPSSNCKAAPKQVSPSVLMLSGFPVETPVKKEIIEQRPFVMILEKNFTKEDMTEALLKLFPPGTGLAVVKKVIREPETSMEERHTVSRKKRENISKVMKRTFRDVKRRRYK